MSNITNDDGREGSNAEPLIDKQPSSRQNTTGSINRTSIRETPVSEGGSLQMDIGESPDDFIDTLNKEETEPNIQERALPNYGDEKDASNGTQVGTEKLPRSRNSTQTSARGRQQTEQDENSVKSRVNSNIVSADRKNYNIVAVEQSTVSKVSRGSEKERQNTERGTVVSDRRKPSADNSERIKKQTSMGSAKQNSTGTTKQGSIVRKSDSLSTKEPSAETPRPPKNPSRNERGKSSASSTLKSPRPGGQLANGKTRSSINGQTKGRTVSSIKEQHKDDGGWGGQNNEMLEEESDKKPQREILQTLPRKKTGSVSPPQPLSNSLVLENGRIPAARQQSTLFKEVKASKNSPRTTDPPSVRLPVLTNKSGHGGSSPKERAVSRESNKKKYVTTTIHTDIAKKRAKADLKEPKMKLAKTESNYVRLAKMVVRIGTDLLRTEFHNYLERQHPPRKLHQFLSANKRRLKSYATSYKLIMKRWEFMYPDEDENKANLLYLDAAILFWFLRYICTLKRPNDFIWKRKPASDDVSETGDIARIRDLRNFLINLSSPALYEDEFERKVKELKQIATRLSGSKQGDIFIDQIEEMKTGSVRFSDRDQYLDILNQWADETGDRNIGRKPGQHLILVECNNGPPAKNVGENIRERREMTRRFLKRHRDPKIFVRTRTYQKAQDKLASSGCVILKGNTGDGKTTMAISLMVAAYDEDECLLITSPEQLEHVDARAVSSVLMDDIFGSGSLNENLFMRWQTLFEDMQDLCTDSKGQVGVRMIITIRQHILDQCYSTLAKYKLFSKDRFFDTTSSEITLQEKRAMLGRHLVACDKQLAKSEIEKAAKSHNSRLGFPQCCALFVMRDGFIISGSQFFERPIEFLFEALDRMYDGNKYGYLAMVIMMFQKDGILFGEKLANPDDDTQFRDKMLDLAFICQIPQSGHIFRFTLEGLQTQVGTFVNYYEDRDCFTFSHESIMEAMMASFGERHPQEVLEGCAVPFLTDFVGTDATFDERWDEIFIMRVKPSNFDVLAKVFTHYILNGEVKKLAQHRAMKDLRFLEFFFNFIQTRENMVDVLLSEDNNFQESPENSRKVGLLFGAIDQEVPNVELVAAILKTAVHNGNTKEAWCDQELIASLMTSIKRGSYDIYKSLVDTGAIDPPDKLMYEEQYLTSVDIVRDLLRRRHWSQEQKDIAIVRASRGIRAESQEIVTLLLQDGAAINSIRCGTTALCEAVKSGKLKTVALLLASGASVDDRDATQQTPLHHACDWNNIEVVKILLKKNADVNARDALGFTPFLVAAGWGRETIMELLFSRRIDPLAVDEQDNTVLHICAANGQTKLMKMIMERFPREMNSILIARNRHGWTPLDFALRCGHLGVTKVLVYSVLKTSGLKSNHRTFVHTRFYVVRLEDFDVTEKYQYRFLDEHLNRTCFQMPRGNWFIQAGNREEYEEVRLFAMKYENKLRQCLAKS